MPCKKRGNVQYNFRLHPYYSDLADKLVATGRARNRSQAVAFALLEYSRGKVKPSPALAKDLARYLEEQRASLELPRMPIYHLRQPFGEVELFFHPFADDELMPRESGDQGTAEPFH